MPENREAMQLFASSFAIAVGAVGPALGIGMLAGTTTGMRRGPTTKVSSAGTFTLVPLSLV